MFCPAPPTTLGISYVVAAILFVSVAASKDPPPFSLSAVGDGVPYQPTVDVGARLKEEFETLDLSLNQLMKLIPDFDSAAQPQQQAAGAEIRRKRCLLGSFSLESAIKSEFFRSAAAAFTNHSAGVSPQRLMANGGCWVAAEVWAGLQNVQGLGGLVLNPLTDIAVRDLDLEECSDSTGNTYTHCQEVTLAAHAESRQELSAVLRGGVKLTVLGLSAGAGVVELRLPLLKLVAEAAARVHVGVALGQICKLSRAEVKHVQPPVLTLGDLEVGITFDEKTDLVELVDFPMLSSFVRTLVNSQTGTIRQWIVDALVASYLPIGNQFVAHESAPIYVPEGVCSPALQ